MLSLGNELKNALRSGKVVLGENESLKSLRQGRGKVIVVAGNARPELKDEVRGLAKIAGIPVLEFPGTSQELGYTLGKPFPVQVMVIIDPGESRIAELVEASAEVK